MPKPDLSAQDIEQGTGKAEEILGVFELLEVTHCRIHQVPACGVQRPEKGIHSDQSKKAWGGQKSCLMKDAKKGGHRKPLHHFNEHQFDRYITDNTCQCNVGNEDQNKTTGPYRGLQQLAMTCCQAKKTQRHDTHQISKV
ncbi:hypothetical protein [Grimontia hollisae]|uniref:hypothetical protein n=1 Tax=Grimontia hollisae TaxID=673 RepID=UPI0021CD8ED4|nr:hypothetical protein [Grimontia hollisae]